MYVRVFVFKAWLTVMVYKQVAQFYVKHGSEYGCRYLAGSKYLCSGWVSSRRRYLQGISNACYFKHASKYGCRCLAGSKFMCCKQDFMCEKFKDEEDEVWWC